RVLEWAFEASAGGQPLPPPGFLADVGHLAFGPDPRSRTEKLADQLPGFPAGLLRSYEDHVLGKFLADATFERAADALRNYRGRDQARGLTFFLQRYQERADFGGVQLSPGVIKGLIDSPAEPVLAQGWESLSQHGPLPLLVQLY